MLQKWLVKEMINIKYILLSFATKAKLIGMFDTLVDELSESTKRVFECFNFI